MLERRLSHLISTQRLCWEDCWLSSRLFLPLKCSDLGHKLIYTYFRSYEGAPIFKKIFCQNLDSAKKYPYLDCFYFIKMHSYISENFEKKRKRQRNHFLPYYFHPKILVMYFLFILAVVLLMLLCNVPANIPI